jgi:cell division protein FtsI (penicillin-binding protein 3)
MKTSDKKWIRIRIYLVAIFFIIGLGINLYRAYILQVVDRQKLNTYARSGYQAIVKLPPKRGTIYDRNGNELAVSLEAGSIYANPRLIEDKKLTAGHLALCLDESTSGILALLNKESPFVWIKRRVSSDKISQLKSMKLKGIGFTTETRRYYPGKDIAGQLLGFVGSDNQGLEGIEKYYETALKGPDETLIQLRDAVGRPFYMSEPEGDGQDMRNITLTIDKAIQYKAQEALEAEIKATSAKGGQCLIMKPDTGEILAMAVAPSFNPNIFNEYKFSDWRNRIVADCFEPGSTIKSFLMATALENKVVTPETAFYCENGQYTIGGHTVHDTHKHGTLTVSDIVTLSSNIGAIKIGQKVGYERFYDQLKKLGFGEKTGIDLKGERDGTVRAPQAAMEIDKANAYFGHGMLVTSLQLATAMCTIANGGRLMKPYLVKEMTDQAGKIVAKNQPVEVRRVWSESTTRQAKIVLENVVSEKGTAQKAAISGYTVAGKTGTPQKINEENGTYSHEKHLSVFVGFVPATNPEMVILVMVDEPRGTGYGGLVAAPVFSQVGKWALNTMRINPDAPIESPKIVKEAKAKNPEAPSKANVVRKAIVEEADTQDADMAAAELVPDFSGQTIRQVIQKGKALGLNVIVDGTGNAIAQYPQAGSPLSGITFIKVTFKPSA